MRNFDRWLDRNRHVQLHHQSAGHNIDMQEEHTLVSKNEEDLENYLVTFSHSNAPGDTIYVDSDDLWVGDEAAVSKAATASDACMGKWQRNELGNNLEKVSKRYEIMSKMHFILEETL
ncbi:hypothetical protein CHS0354_006495 [Potamilus streckersoni]|uniref:Uncharacterized protein n=1 Tax=Potamilus streckersoni TaxID=2493646 RepID=A0AAE0RM09_9BIVA|nr:hypothetical protein CHS0354_006495 [Potamilus streckersoni]